MTATASTHAFRRQNLLSSKAQAYVRESLPIIDLNAIGDVHVLSTSFLEQVSGIDSIAFEAMGTTATRTYTVEFGHSTDNTTWTSYVAATLANLQAVAYVANNRCYYRWRFTRTGSDATGIISVRALSLGYTFDPSALSNHGAFTDVSIRGDVKQFLAAVIQSRVIQSYGEDRWDVKSYEARQSSKAKKNEILIAAINTGGTTEQFINEGNWPITCDLLVKVHGGNGGDPQGYNTEYDEMCGILETIYRRDQNAQYRYSFTFKGIDFVSVALSDLGPSRFSIDDRGDVYDQITDSVYHRYQLSFTIFAIRKLQGI